MDAASLEQMNKLRKSLGLPLLPTPGAATDGPTFKEHESSDEEGEPASTLERREAAGFENYQQIQEQQRAAKQREEKKAAIAKARDAAKRFSKLEGKGLGDIDEGGDLDAKSWLKGQSKRQKKIEKDAAAKLEQELAERERLAAIQYSSKDLAGIKIGHEIDDFAEGESEQILTLKDANIDENDEDELESADLIAREKLKEKLDLKKKKPVYDPNAVDETGERKILAQYDEEIDGKKRKRFMLDEAGVVMDDERDTKRQETGAKLRSEPISLDFFKEEAKSDYMDISEIKIKKPKKSKKSRQKTYDDDIFPEPQPTNGSAMDLDEGPEISRPKSKTMDSSFVDDEDLQQSLAASRRAAFKKQKRMKPEDLARRLQEEAATPEPEADTEEPGLVLDETSNFVDNLQAVRPEAQPETKPNPLQKSVESPAEAASPTDEDGDVNMQQQESYAGIEDEDELLSRLQREQETHTPEISGTGLDAEATLDSGLGATLTLLKQRGLVKNTHDGSDLNSLQRSRAAFLQSRKLREGEAEQKARMQRERDRASGKMAGMSNRERENAAQWSNQQRDQVESREQARLFEQHYKPDVNLKYVDEMGRSMNQKEAFKHLSHAFHGKGSGKQKTEKRLKKIDEEKKREAMSSLDSSQARGMDNAMQTTVKKNKTAGVRLG